MKKNILIFSAFVILVLFPLLPDNSFKPPLTNSFSTIETELARFDNNYGSFLDCYSTASFLYLACGYGGLVILDITLPSKPVLVGFLDTLGSIEKVFFDQGFVYAITNQREIVIIDVHLPSSPVVVGHFLSDASFSDLFVQDAFLFLTSYDGSLHVFDVSNKASISLLTIYFPENFRNALSIFVLNHLVFLGTDFGFEILNFTTVTNPELLSNWTPSSSWYSIDIFIDGPLLYTLNFFQGLLIFNISEIAHPVFLGSWEASGENTTFLGRMSIKEHFVFIIDYWQNAFLVNCSAPTNPEILSIYGTSTGFSSVAWMNNFVYLTDCFDGLDIVNVSNLTAPSRVSFFKAGGMAEALALSEKGFIYLANGYDGNLVFSFQNKLLTLIDQVDFGGPYRSLDVIGDLLFSTADLSFEGRPNSRKIEVFNTSTATLEKVFEEPLFFGTNFKLLVNNNNTLFISYVLDTAVWKDECGVKIFNVTHPLALNEVNSLSYGTNSRYTEHGFAFDGNIVLLGANSGLAIYDLTLPSDQSEICRINSNGTIKDIIVQNKVAFIANSMNGLEIFDISSVATPQKLASIAIDEQKRGEELTLHSLCIVNQTLFLGVQNKGIIIFDISDLTAPREIWRINEAQDARDMVLQNNLLYVADGLNGLRIFQINFKAIAIIKARTLVIINPYITLTLVIFPIVICIKKQYRKKNDNI